MVSDFITITIDRRIDEARAAIAEGKALYVAGHCESADLVFRGAANKLRHAADELEAEALERIHGISQGH